ncbi:aminodeoxychorismate synthase component I [Sulfurimonas sp.]|uniref:aminodeoxychorismate synthase component I n=1 Tax=Sulfurimonas sp. TaxID=2022749 RepID=UPI00262110C6|nr:aminodeoxychorismate synthase component I [Sulfurimonas sp.]
MSFKRINSLASKREPFLFISDFEAKNIEVIPLNELESEDIEFTIDANYIASAHPHRLRLRAIDFIEYKKKFEYVIEKIKAGETYLLNLTQETPLEKNLSLKEMYTLANAHYKLRYKDEFICFSPETFIQIQGDTITTFPMKGTIDATVKNAKEKILADEKEMAEHVMIVDLLRNDLSIVAKEVQVEKFRYITKIEAGEKELLQVSSKISAKLPQNWHENLGDILKSLLPAGSISGTPKKSTLKIIKEIEGYERKFFSGVFGIYDGKSFDSGVMIRFIEKREEKFFYKSGGGITLDSSVESEYQEMLDKIYLP